MRSASLLAACVLTVFLAACSKASKDSPTGPTPTGAVSYTAIGASDGAGVGSSVVCVPFVPCSDGMGWVQRLHRRLQQDGEATLTNLSVPSAVLSPTIVALGQRVGRDHLGNFLTNQAPFTARDSTIVTVFAGGNDANTIATAVRNQIGGDDFRAYIDQQVRQWGDDYAALLAQIRARASNPRIVLLNLPNLAGAPYVARNTQFERQILQRIAVGLSERANALAGPNVHVVDLLCDARVLDPTNFSSDGFHPNDRGYALLADLAYSAATGASYPAPQADCALRRVVPPL
ncbi:MAG: SGNH/GDSL hydrolase family protein [Vicinamibacterales bacterium]